MRRLRGSALDRCRDPGRARPPGRESSDQPHPTARQLPARVQGPVGREDISHTAAHRSSRAEVGGRDARDTARNRPSPGCAQGDAQGAHGRKSTVPGGVGPRARGNGNTHRAPGGLRARARRRPGAGPSTVQALLAARIDRLRSDEKHLLQCAAVIGNEIPLALLEGVADLDEESLPQALGRLRSSELLYEARLFPDPEYTFKHALVQDVAYQGLLHERRRTLHCRVGELIESRSPGRPAEHAETLGAHFEQGEAWDKAARYLLAAAQQSRERFAYTAALRFCERALECAERSPGSA